MIWTEIAGIIRALYILYDVYEHYKVDEHFGFVAFGVQKDNRRRGIGLKIHNAAVNIAKNLELGLNVLEGKGSSNFSQKIYRKLEFDIPAKVMFTYENHKKNGEVVFKNMGDDRSVRLYGKVNWK